MALIVLFLGAFCLGTAEFMATGLLTQVSSDLGVSIPVAGTIVTAYALGVAFGGPIMGIALGPLSRKRVLIGLIGFFALMQFVCAFAPGFEVLLVGRILGAACQGAFLGIASIVAMTIAGPGKSGRALSLLVAGITVSNIVGLPGGTFIGNLFGWRMSFVALGASALAVVFLIALFVPATEAENAAKPPLSRQFRALLNRDVLLSYAVMTLGSIGFFSLFTFITPLLTTVTGLSAGIVPVLLIGFGVGSTIGALAGGRLADWKPTPTLITMMVVEVLVFLVVLVAADQAIAMVGALIVLGFCAFAYSPSLFVRLFRAAREAPDLASTLISTAFNVGIAAGSTIGAVALANGAAYPDLAWIGVFAASAALLAILSMVVGEQRHADAVHPVPAE